MVIHAAFVWRVLFPPLQQLAPTAYLWVNILQRSNARVVDEFMGGSLDHLLMQARAQT